MGILSFLFGVQNTTPTVSYADTAQFILIDVRTPSEYEESHVIGAENIDFLNQDFEDKILKLDKTKIYKLYCRSGNRSGQAEKRMKTLGFKNVENLGSVAQASKKLNTPCESKSC